MGGITKAATAVATGGLSLIPGIPGVSNFLGDPAGALTSTAQQVNPGVTLDQIHNAYDTTQSAIDKQAAFVKALQAQNGIGNQSAVFNQLQGVANGTGPNPALAQLNQSTGQNIASQAALMASARGASANPGLIARQAALQGGNLQQQAAGQAATLQAQQQLGAMNQLGGIAGQQVGQQQNAITGYNQFAQGQQQNLLNALAAGNKTNADVGTSNAANKNKTIGGLLNGGGSALSALFAAHGGEIPDPQYMYQGGSPSLGANINFAPPQALPAPSTLGVEQMPAQTNMVFQQHTPQQPSMLGVQPMPELQGFDHAMAFMAGQPYVDTARQGLTDAQEAAARNKVKPQGGESSDSKEDPFSQGMGKIGTVVGGAIKSLGNGPVAASSGAMIPGKAKVKGDNLKNDTVPAVLSPGEIVIPRSIAQGKNAPEKAAQFVAACLAKKGRKLG